MTAKKQPNEKEYITNKVLLVFSVCLLGVLGLMLLYRLLNIGSSYGVGILITRIALALSAAGTVCGLAKIAFERKKGEDTRFRLSSGCNIAVACGVLTAVLLVIAYFGAAAIKPFYVILPAIAVFYLIYHSYPREFFVVSLDCGAAAGLLWFARTALTSSSYASLKWAAVAAAAVLALLQIALMLHAKKHGSKGLVDGRMTELFTSPHAYVMMLVSVLAMAAFVVAGALLGAQAAYYLVFAALAYLFVAAVYYTVKML